MAPVALLAHGAGSAPVTVLRLLSPAVPTGVRTLALDARGSVDDVVARIAAAAEDEHVVLAAGVSLGAHAVALWAARGGRAGSLLLAMPAWSGPPAEVAALTAATADAVARRGADAVLAEVRATAAPEDWVVEELAAGWAAYDDDALAAALRAAAASPGPTPDELATIAAPTAVVALADDPLHPEALATAWAAAVPGARLAVVGRQAPTRDRGALGRAGRAVLDGLSGSR